MPNYIVASSKDWFTKDDLSESLRDDDFVFVSKKEELTLEFIDTVQPHYIFFPHWNWIVPTSIHTKYECIVFHTAPLPYGRGGSPIQNLIMAGFNESPICALKMTNEIDGGPIYDKEMISLDGNLHDIFNRAVDATNGLILNIINNNPKPVAQEGEPFYFKRRSKSDGQITPEDNLKNTFNKIRMLDGLDYPRSFIRIGDKRIEFSDAGFEGEKINATALISFEEASPDAEGIVEYLNENKSEFEFSTIVGQKSQIEELYNLLIFKSDDVKISSKKTTSRADHERFVKNHPYRYWFLVKRESDAIASLYVKFDNTLSINMTSFDGQSYKKILLLIMEAIKPVPGIPSITPANFIINLSDKNEECEKILDELNFNIIQKTFSIQS
jgi:methionyl-tRNA formyltransferase